MKNCGGAVRNHKVSPPGILFLIVYSVYEIFNTSMLFEDVIIAVATLL